MWKLSRNSFKSLLLLTVLLALARVPAIASGPIDAITILMSGSSFTAGVTTNTPTTTVFINTFSSGPATPSAGELVTLELLSGGVVIPNGIFPSSFTTTGTGIVNGGNTSLPLTFFHAGSGDIQIRATSAVQAIVANSATFTVAPSSTAKLLVLGPGMTQVPGTNPAVTQGYSGTFAVQEPEQPFTVTIILTDAQFNTVAATDQVSFSAGDLVILPSPLNLVAGTKDASVTMTGARITRTLTATDDTNGAVQNGTLNITTAGPPEKEIFPFPSPFNPHRENITFRFRLTDAKSSQVIVTDLFGQNVWKHEVGGTVGFNNITWDGRNDAGVVVAAGVYNVMLEVDGTIESRKQFGVSK